MSDGFDALYVDTRRQLRRVAESLIAGPQHRAAGTIRLAVRPDGYAAALSGPINSLAEAAGVDSGFWNAPFGALYPLDPAHDVDALTSQTADFFHRSRKEL
jgi:hypothetical protein